MIPFAVKVRGLHDPEGKQAAWVLAVDRAAGLLVVHDDRSLHWHPLAECTFVKLAPPDAPRPVVAVQPPGGPSLVIPTSGRANGR